jgi:hypothetical protein
MKYKAFLGALGGALVAASSANAAVTYILNGGNVGFQLTLPSYVTAYQNFPAATLDSCTPLPGSVCESVDIAPAGQQLSDRLFLNMASATPGGNGGILGWQFTAGALGQDGVYLALNSFEVTTLTVRSTAAVPEPASWALMIGGFGLAGAALRRRRVSARV